MGLIDGNDQVEKNLYTVIKSNQEQLRNMQLQVPSRN